MVMQSEIQPWNKKRGERLKSLLGGEYGTPANASMVLAALVLTEPQDPRKWIKAAKQAISQQHQARYKLEALVKLLPNGKSAAGMALRQLVDKITDEESTTTRPQLNRWFRGGVGRSMTEKWLDRFAWLLDLDREQFLEKISASPAPAGQATKPAGKPRPAKSEAWTVALLATELMFPKGGSGPVNARRFYEGWPVTSSELSADCDFRRTFQEKEGRIDYAGLLAKRIFPALNNAKAQRSVPVFLFTGPGGAGKSTVLERVGFKLAQSKDARVAVMRFQKQADQIDPKDVLWDCTKAVTDGGFKVVALFMDEASAQAQRIGNLIAMAHRQHAKICLFLAEQGNKRELLPRDAEEFSLGRLGDEEIRQLLGRLEKFDCLGVLKDKTEEERLELFRSEQRYDKQLLVALREVTTGKRFDTIIFEEWQRIPMDTGKALYLYAAILHCVGSYLSEEVARRSLGCLTDSALWRRIRDACRDIVISHRAPDSEMGTAVKARHAIIAEALVSARFLENRTPENANDFGEDAAEILYALEGMRNERTKRSIFRIVHQFVLSQTFVSYLANATDIKRLCGALSYFDEVWGESHNNFIVAVYRTWVEKGASTLASMLLEEIVALGRDGVASFGWCVSCWVSAIIRTKSPEQISRVIQQLKHLQMEYSGEDTPTWLWWKLADLYEAAGDLGIAWLEQSLRETVGENSTGRSKATSTLSRLLERRFLEKHAPEDLKRAAKLIEELLNDDHLSGDLTHLISRYAQLALEPKYREHIGDLDSAISLVERSFAAVKNQKGDSPGAGIALSRLLERRFLEERGPKDLKRAAKLIEELLNDDHLNGDPTHLISRYAQLALEPKYREHIGDLDSAISLVERSFAAVKNQKGDSPGAGIVLSRLLERRFLEEHGPKDLKRAAKLIEELLNDDQYRAAFGDLMSRYAQLALEPKYREHIGDLDSAIHIVERGFVALKDQTEGDSPGAGIVLGRLLERRFLEKHGPEDLKRAAKLIEELLNDDHLSGDPTHLISRYAQLALEPKYREHIGDLDSAISLVERSFAAVKNQKGDSLGAGIALSRMLERRFLEKHDSEDLKGATTIIENLLADECNEAKRPELSARREFLVELVNLDVAIDRAERRFVSLKGHDEGKLRDAAITLSRLLECRSVQKRQRVDLQRAAKVLDGFDNYPTLMEWRARFLELAQLE